MLKEILFTAGGVSLLGFGVLSIHWNIREVVAYKTGIGRKVRVVKDDYNKREFSEEKARVLQPLGKIQFSKTGVESTGSDKLEVAEKPAYLHTQAVVGSLDDAISSLLEKQDEIVPSVSDDMLDNVDVDVYDGTRVLVESDEHTQVLVESEENASEPTMVLVEDVNEHTTVMVEPVDGGIEKYFTEILDNEPDLASIEEGDYTTQVLSEGIQDEYLTQVLGDDSYLDENEDDDYYTQNLSDEDFEYVTQVLNEREESFNDESYVTQVLVGADVEVVEDDSYVTQVLVGDEPDYETKILVTNDRQDYGTVSLVDNEGVTGDIVGASVENEELVGVEGLEVLYTNYELESK